MKKIFLVLSFCLLSSVSYSEETVMPGSCITADGLFDRVYDRVVTLGQPVFIQSSFWGHAIHTEESLARQQVIARIGDGAEWNKTLSLERVAPYSGGEAVSFASIVERPAPDGGPAQLSLEADTYLRFGGRLESAPGRNALGEYVGAACEMLQYWDGYFASLAPQF